MTRERAEKMIGQKVWVWDPGEPLVPPEMFSFNLTRLQAKQWPECYFRTEAKAWEAKALWHEGQAKDARKRAEGTK